MIVFVGYLTQGYEREKKKLKEISIEIDGIEREMGWPQP